MTVVLGNLVVNSSRTNDFYSIAGTVITAQPKTTGGASQALGSNQTLLDDAAAKTSDTPARIQSNFQTGANAAYLGTAVVASAVADSGGFCNFTSNAHTLAVGDKIVVYGSTTKSLEKIHTVTSIAVNSFVTGTTYAASATAGSYRPVNSSYSFNVLTEGRYIMIRGGANTEFIAGVADTTLRSGGQAGDPRRSIHQVESVRSFLVATAIIAGNWNIVSGWSSYPGEQDDISTWETRGEDEVGIPSQSKPGELVYKTSADAPTQDDYAARSQW